MTTATNGTDNHSALLRALAASHKTQAITGNARTTAQISPEAPALSA